MYAPSSDSSRDPFLAELLAFSAKAAVRKTSERSPQKYDPGAQLSAANWHKDQMQDPTVNWAAAVDANQRSMPLMPLMPLRERDAHELADLFKLEEIDAIEADIARNLKRRCPEPCWEDSPFDFLRDYL